MVYGIKGTISIINMLDTVVRFRNALTILSSTIRGRRSIWFLNSNVLLNLYTTRLARVTSEISISTDR
jgi:ribosomal protein S2